MSCGNNGTVIVYNGIELRDVLTEGIDQTVVYDGSDVDPIGLKVIVSCSARVHAAATFIHGSWAGAGGNLPQHSNAITTALLAPRRRFQMWIGSNILFDVRPGEVESCNPTLKTTAFNLSDIEHGPRTQLKILRVLGQQALHVQFRCEFTVPFCATYDQFRGLLNLRFWITDEISGQDWLTTRTYHGRLRVAHPGINRHTIGRCFAIPPLQAKFRRESIELAEDPNGLELQFTVRDVEQNAAAPFPATHWDGTYEVSLPYGGMTCEAEVRFTLWGAPHTPKSDLLQLAAKILRAKLHTERLNQQGANKGQIFLLNAGFTEDLRENKLSVHARVKFVQPTNIPAVVLNLSSPDPNNTMCAYLDSTIVGGVTSAGETYQYDRSVPYAPQALVLGENLAGLMNCALQNPCCPIWLNASVPNGTEFQYAEPPQSMPDYPEPQVMATSTPLDAYPPADLSNEHYEACYTSYKMTSRLSGNTGRKSLPLAAASSTGTSSGATTRAVDMLAPMYRRIITIEAERLNKAPQLPSLKREFTDSNGITHRLENVDISPNAAVMCADGTNSLISAAATYEYSLSRAPRDNESVPVGHLPYRAAGADTYNSIDASLFVDPEQILLGNQQPAGPTGPTP